MKCIVWLLFFSTSIGRTQPFLAKSQPINKQIRAKYLPFGFLDDLYWRGYNYGIGYKLNFTSNIGFEAILNVAQRSETTEYCAFDEQNNVSNKSKTSLSPVIWLRSTLFIQLKGKDSVL